MNSVDVGQEATLEGFGLESAYGSIQYVGKPMDVDVGCADNKLRHRAELG